MGKILKGIGKIFGGGSDSAAKKQAKAMEEANRIAKQQLALSEQQINEANAKTPDLDAIREENKEDIGSTMLTGAGGAEVDEKNKKKKTLLGG